MATRMTGSNGDLIREILRIRHERPELFLDEGPGTFYRNQRLMALVRDGIVNLDNVSEYMTKKKLSERYIPMDWYYFNGEDIQDSITREQIAHMRISAKKFNKRGRVTLKRFKLLLRAILERRIDKYSNPEKYMNNRILCIVGESGAGKTLASLHLKYKLGANTICSFTTRPPRDTEVEGRDHHFINIVPDLNELLAYAKFGGYEYYALKTQVFGPCTVYVIDEEGLRNLKRDHGDEYEIYSVYLKRDYSKRRKMGVDKNRIDRDKDRQLIDENEYDWVIENNSSKKNLFISIETIYNQIANKEN